MAAGAFRLNAQQALNVAKEFLQQSNIQAFSIDAVRRKLDEGQWRVVVRIGNIFGPTKEIIIDDASGAVVSYGDSGAAIGPR